MFWGGYLEKKMINFLIFNNLVFIANLFFLFSCFGSIDKKLGLPIILGEKFLDSSQTDSSGLLKKTVEGIIKSEKHKLTAKIGEMLKTLKSEDLRVSLETFLRASDEYNDLIVSYLLDSKFDDYTKFFFDNFIIRTREYNAFILDYLNSSTRDQHIIERQRKFLIDLSLLDEQLDDLLYYFVLLRRPNNQQKKIFLQRKQDLDYKFSALIQVLLTYI